jgi:hypothetical protein
MPSKADVTEMRIRLPRAVHDWIKGQAEQNACSMNAEVVRSCVDRIKRTRKAEARRSAPPAEMGNADSLY